MDVFSNILFTVLFIELADVRMRLIDTPFSEGEKMYKDASFQLLSPIRLLYLASPEP